MDILPISDPFSLLSRFNQLPAVRHLVVALSGGLDSVVLLHSLCLLRPELTQQIKAVHIHHGLMPDADHWTRHCSDFCASLEVPFEVVRIQVETKKNSIEAAAREARYAALASFINADTALLTAHHQDDQLETVMLHLIKGAGPAGLAGMPGCKPFADGWHFRPLLDYPRDRLLHYASEHELVYVEDSSNTDRQFERNYLRHQVIPELKSRWPAVGKGVSRAARHQSDVISVSATLAASDLSEVQTTDGALNIRPLQQLHLARQQNVLRYWLRNLGGLDANPSEAQLESIQRELIGSAWDSEPKLQVGTSRIYRYRNLLYQLPWQQTPSVGESLNWPLNKPLRVGSLGLHLDPTTVLNVFPRLNSGDELTVRFRQGGEKIKLPGSGQHKSLKKLFQSLGVPPWRRHRIPLLYFGDQLLIVWGYAAGSFE